MADLVEEKNVENLARKINVLINDEERYQQFKQGALVTAEKYSYENIAKNMNLKKLLLTG